MDVIAYAALAYLATAGISLAAAAVILGINRLFSSAGEEMP